MPIHNVGDKTNLDRTDLFAQLKAKGEMITFRLAQGAYSYDGKHFTKKDNGKWDIQPCPRVMDNQDCEKCETYFDLARQIKALKEEDNKKNAGQIKKLEDQARPFKAKLTFYYAILNRTLKQAQILQVPMMIRVRIEELNDNGFKVVGTDFVYKRTEKPGKDYYFFERVDSADAEALDEVETAEYEKATKFDIGKITMSKVGSHPVDDGEEIPPSEPQ